jgi:hypothetical protein
MFGTANADECTAPTQTQVLPSFLGYERVAFFIGLQRPKLHGWTPENLVLQTG